MKKALNTTTAKYHKAKAMPNGQQYPLCTRKAPKEGDFRQFRIANKDEHVSCKLCLEKMAGKTSEVKPEKAKKIKGKTVEEFIEFLEETLIPDLKESGSDFTAEDFETAVKWIKHFKG